MQIKTACWFAKIPDDHIRIGISRGTPRGTKAGFRKYPALNPGPWFKSVEPAEYLRLYGEQLSKLDPPKVAAEILTLASEREKKIPVLCCFENVPKVHSGEQWCHRHLVAQWLEDSLGIEVPELDHPELDRFARLKALGGRSLSGEPDDRPAPPHPGRTRRTAASDLESAAPSSSAPLTNRSRETESPPRTTCNRLLQQNLPAADIASVTRMADSRQASAQECGMCLFCHAQEETIRKGLQLPRFSWTHQR